MRHGNPFALSLLAAAATLPAQANDWSGLRVYEAANPANGVPTPIVCGSAFSCTPASFTIPTGSPMSFLVMGELNGFYAIAASFDLPNLGCLPLGVPGLAHMLALPPGSLVTMALGLTATSDNGRCNGGVDVLAGLFAIPSGFPSGALAFQAISSTPLSVGGSGFALSNTVVVNW
ncbi:MAG: hypothetical protein U1E73_14275 [Planctomycetota bacterium]